MAESGIKTVFALYQDVAGNWSEPFVDSIVCDLPLDLISEVLPPGTVGFPYVSILSAAGGWPPYRWDLVSGSLPPRPEP